MSGVPRGTAPLGAWRDRIIASIGRGRSTEYKLSVLRRARADSLAMGGTSPEGLAAVDREIARLERELREEHPN